MARLPRLYIWKKQKHAERWRECGRLARDQDLRNYTVVTSWVFFLSHASHTRCQGSQQPRNTNGSKWKRSPESLLSPAKGDEGTVETQKTYTVTAWLQPNITGRQAPTCNVDTTCGTRTSIPLTASMFGLWQEAQWNIRNSTNDSRAPLAIPERRYLQRPWGEARTLVHNQQ